MFATEGVDDQLTKLNNTSKVLDSLLAEIDKIRSDAMKEIMKDKKETTEDTK